MPIDKEELTERAQLVRLYEASTGIDFPTPEESNFRRCLMIKLGLAFNMREVRDKQIAGPGNVQRPPTPAANARGK